LVASPSSLNPKQNHNPLHAPPPQVVPTLYVSASNASLASNQYSVTEHFRETPGQGGSPSTSTRTLPGLFFFYDRERTHTLPARRPLRCAPRAARGGAERGVLQKRTGGG
jgi:hypothetical protein